MAEYTLQEIGSVMGVNGERIRQIEVAALRKCRQWCEANGYRPEDLLREMPRSSGYAPPPGFRDDAG